MRDWQELMRRWGWSPGSEKTGAPSLTELLPFEGPQLNPVPVPTLGAVPEFDAWDFLRYVDPIDDPGMLSFQVAQLTVGMTILRDRLTTLEAAMIQHGDWHERETTE